MDFTHSALPIIIAVAVLASIVACALFLWVQARKKLIVSFDVEHNSTGHVWDDDLKELNNPMPRWWMVLFIITIVFALAYVYLYPGLAAHTGQLGWTSHQQYEQEKAALNAQAAPLYAQYMQLSDAQLAAHSGAMQMAERLFLNNCAQCHGADARGSKGFPNLTDNDWLHGGGMNVIQTSIAQGRHGVMPALASQVGNSDDVRAVAQYVLSLSGRATDSRLAAFGKPGFIANCAACHGANGKGNQAIGAPNLSDKIWLYGGSERAIVETIRLGRNNNMPAHQNLLSADQIRILAAYVWRFSQSNNL